jgi:F-type H+-transporting ATPase subunit b
MAILADRSRAVDGDIAKAEGFRSQAAEAEKAYAATMSAAHGEARKKLAETHAANVATLADRTREAAADFDRKVSEASASIETARLQAMNSLRAVAQDLAADITRKLVDRAPSADSVSRAVDRAAGTEFAQ